LLKDQAVAAAAAFTRTILSFVIQESSPRSSTAHLGDRKLANVVDLRAFSLFPWASPSPQAPVVITSKARSERPELTADRQQHVNSKSALFQLCSCSDLRFYRPFRFDFIRELVSRTTLTL
jgi:hypothetical protein